LIERSGEAALLWWIRVPVRDRAGALLNDCLMKRAEAAWSADQTRIKRGL